MNEEQKGEREEEEEEHVAREFEEMAQEIREDFMRNELQIMRQINVRS